MEYIEPRKMVPEEYDKNYSPKLFWSNGISHRFLFIYHKNGKKKEIWTKHYYGEIPKYVRFFFRIRCWFISLIADKKKTDAYN